MPRLSAFPDLEAITAFPKLLNINVRAPRTSGKFALYTLVPISDVPTFLAKVNKDDDLNDDDDDDDPYIVLPPQHDFTSSTLADVMEYHLALTTRSEGHTSNASEVQFEAEYFMVAIQENCSKHGVLIVDVMYQYYSDDEVVPMLVRCPVASDDDEEEDVGTAVLNLVNLEIANVDMYEVLEGADSKIWPRKLPGYPRVRKQLDQALADHKKRHQDRFLALPRRTERYAIHHIGAHNRNLSYDAYYDDIERDRSYKEDCEVEDRVATTGEIDWA